MKTPAIQIIRASNPDARLILCLEEIGCNDPELTNDEIDLLVATAAESIAQQLRAKVRVEPPILPFIRGTFDHERYWTIGVNDF